MGTDTTGTGGRRDTGTWALVGLATVVLVLVVVGIVAADDDQPVAEVRVAGAEGSSATGSSTTAAEGPTPTLVIGEVGDVTVDVSPREGLADGELVTVTVAGRDALADDALLFMCTGEVRDVDPTATTAAGACDTEAVTSLDGMPGPDLVEGDQQVAVSRFLQVVRGEDLNMRQPYDCATEPAGCILVLAPFRLPPAGIGVPLGFADGTVPAPEATATPAADLTAGQVVTVEATGLRPHATHDIGQCAPLHGPGGWGCDWETYVAATTDAEGRLRVEVPVRPAIYPWTGRVDCTATSCALGIGLTSGEVEVAAEIGFAEGVVAPMPVLSIDEPGPYVDGQEITVRGTGFPPGRAIGGEIGLCPADRDTAHEERCTYDIDPAVVAPDGTFTMTRLVGDDLFSGPCAVTGCQIGWVLPKGTTVAPVPVEIVPAG